VIGFGLHIGVASVSTVRATAGKPVTEKVPAHLAWAIPTPNATCAGC
jgi:hypothetical protein